MKNFTELKSLNEMRYGQPLLSEKDVMKNQLIAACGNDERVLCDLVDCLTDKQMKDCFTKLSKKYQFTGEVGQGVQADGKNS